MAQEPYFPPPRTPGPAYREPAVLPVARPVVPARRVEVSRPEAPAAVDPPDAPPKPQPPLGHVLREERTYWQRHRLFARFPRAIGLVLVVVSGGLLYSTVHTLLYGGYYGVRSAVAGPAVLFIGLWSVAFGYPLEPNGRPPAWWQAGMAACAVTGFLIGIALLAALSD